MSFPARCRLALKEWAVTERALAEGEQVLLLRKGGIHEEGKEFRVIHREFLLYPTYEHQREDLLKPRYREDLRAVLAEPHNPQQITFSQWARVQEVIEVTERQKVEALSPHYIWTTDYAEQRLHWKPRSPLQILLVRLYWLAAPQTIPFLAAYAGCKSWVALEQEVSLGALTPMLSEEKFRAKAEMVRRVLTQCT